MADPKSCPQCGAPLAADAPEGLCRACLLKLGLEATSLSTTDAEVLAGWTPPAPGDLATRFPDLEILELVGRGGMGAVYKARQKSLDRLVALKILPPEIGRDADFTERFAGEAQALARLNHPHIVTIYDFGRREGLYFFVMEYVDGPSVRQLLNTGRVASPEALAIVPQICDALQYAHDHGIVHRDIKPENILLNRRGQVKIADFGLAKLVGIHSPTRTAERVLGTPEYMAPEQVERPAEVDHRADIYSLGVVFYQMLTGELPSQRIEPPSKKVVIDVRLDEIVLRALEKNPERRYQQVSEIKTQVETITSSPRQTDDIRLAPLHAPLKSSRGYFTTPEDFATPYGGFWGYAGKGELALYEDRLVFTGGWPRTDIPFASLRELGVARGPRWKSPAGHQYLSIIYDEKGQRKNLLFMAGDSLFITPHESRRRAAEWILAIRETVKTATGKEVPCVAGKPAVVPASPWGTVLVGLPLLLVNIVLVWLSRSMWLRVGSGQNFPSALWLMLCAPVFGIAIGFIIMPLWAWYVAKKSSNRARSASTIAPGNEASVLTLPRRSIKGLVVMAWLFPAILLAPLFYIMKSNEAMLREARSHLPPAPSEQVLIAALKRMSEHNAGRFPDTLDKEAISAITLDWIRKHSPRGQKIEPDQFRELTDLSLALNQGLQFAVSLPAEANARYAGKGIRRGNSTAPVFWYKPLRATNYRVIYGDLSVKEQNAAPKSPEGVPVNAGASVAAEPQSIVGLRAVNPDRSKERGD